ncbi:MAG TPA: GGDEF domain-containing protein [Thermoanaerobaculia bacterium]|nr:GGDEF domain-containing protein [Thermoanaerobaculia bacterium]
MLEGFVQIGLMALQGTVVAALLGLLYRARSRMGLLPLVVAVGALQYLHVVLLRSVYVEIAPGVEISPGSAILFTATLFAILLVHASEEAERTRDFVYGLVLAYLAAIALSALFGLTLTGTSVRNPFGLPAELLTGDLALRSVRGVSLLVEAACAIAVYQALSGLAARPSVRLLLAASAAILFDGAILAAVSRALDGPVEARRVVLDVTTRGVVAAAYAGIASRFVPELRASGGGVSVRGADESVRGADESSARTRSVNGGGASESGAAPPRPRPLRLGELVRLLTFREIHDPGRGERQRDPLTGLLHRGFFDASLPLEIERSQRAGAPVSLLLADVDHFKSINDRFGHAAGDRVLKEVAAALREAVRAADAACRIGGEEFAVIAPHAGSGAALQLAQRIQTRLAARLGPGVSRTGAERVTVTIGAATFPGDATSAAELFRVADERLYEGKRTGRDRVIGGTKAGYRDPRIATEMPGE